MEAITTDGTSHIITWNDCLIEFFKKERIFLEYPWKIEGVYKNGDKLRVQKGAIVERYSNMPKYRIVSMGAYSYSRTASMSANFKCGRYCSVAKGVELSDQEHPTKRISSHPFTTHAHMRNFASSEFGKKWDVTSFRTLGPAPEIMHDVWVGGNALLRRGIRIETGAIVAGRAVVTRDVPPYAIVGGSPARVLKLRFSEGLVQRLLESKWWEYNFCDLPDPGTEDVESFLEKFEEIRDTGAIKKFDPGLIDIEETLFPFILNNIQKWE